MYLTIIRFYAFDMKLKTVCKYKFGYAGKPNLTKPLTSWIGSVWYMDLGPSLRYIQVGADMVTVRERNIEEQKKENTISSISLVTIH